MSVLKNFKQSAGRGATIGLAVSTVAAVVVTGYVLRQHQKTLNLHSQAIQLNTAAILTVVHYAGQTKSNNG